MAVTGRAVDVTVLGGGALDPDANGGVAVEGTGIACRGTTKGRSAATVFALAGGVAARVGAVGGVAARVGPVGGIAARVGAVGSVAARVGAVGGVAARAGAVGGVVARVGAVGGVAARVGAVGGVAALCFASAAAFRFSSTAVRLRASTACVLFGSKVGGSVGFLT